MTRMSACSSQESCASTSASTPWAPTAVPAFLASHCRMMAAPAGQVRPRWLEQGLVLPGEHDGPVMGPMGSFPSCRPTPWNRRHLAMGFVRPGCPIETASALSELLSARAAPAPHPRSHSRARTQAAEAPSNPAQAVPPARGPRGSGSDRQPKRLP